MGTRSVKRKTRKLGLKSFVLGLSKSRSPSRLNLYIYILCKIIEIVQICPESLIHTIENK